MSKTKRFIEEVSVEMGKDGEIDDEVIEEASRRMAASKSQQRRLNHQLKELKDKPKETKE